MSNDKLECVCFGAGALGLGFLGPELSPECRVTYVDVPAKASLLDHLHGGGDYAFNQTGLAMRAVRIPGADGLAIAEGTAARLRDLLDRAHIVFTAVGEPNLPRLAPAMAAAALGRTAAAPLRILCGENGVEIARTFREAVLREAGRDPGDALRVGDTVMGRMCKVVADPEPPVEPAAPGLDWAVVAEPFFGIPVEAHALAGLPRIPAALSPQNPARFSASEDVKMLSHNGLHATLGCLGYLRGALYFDELRADHELMALGQRLLLDEAGGALLKKHGDALGRNEYLNYSDSIPRRVTCPVFHDSVERGVRGIMRKLEPSERLVYSVRTVAAQGIKPEAFATGLAAAVIVAQRTGETELDFREVLTTHCAFDPDRDAGLLALVEARRAALSEED